MSKKALTAASVARLKLPATGQLDVYDRGYPGLFLRLSYGGTRTFSMAYRFGDRQRRISLGIWPAMELGEAREAWRAIREKVSRGIDPAIQNEPRQKDEFGEVAAEWLRRDQADNRSHSAVARLFNRDVLPYCQHKPIAEITRRDALELIDRVVDRGSPVMARRLHAHVHRLFEWAVGRGIIEANPMHRLPKAGDETPRDRMLSENELRLVWQAADDWPFGAAYRLLILTGARLREIGELRWSEISGDIIRLEGDRTKNGLPHTIPLSAPALAVIEGLHRMPGDLVFTTTGKTPISGWSRAKYKLDETVAQLNGGSPLKPWHVHDFRRTIATGMQKLGVEERVIDAALGHINGGLRRVYQVHAFDSEKREALDLWGAHVTGLVESRSLRKRAR